MHDDLRQQTERLRESLDQTDAWHAEIAEVIETLGRAFERRATVYVAGNGGSATLAQHLSDEMVGRYRTNRPPLPVVALTADSAVLTCIGNDFGFEEVFRRQIEALGRRGDVLVVFSTSGTSQNIIAACRQARQQGLTTVGFSGAAGDVKDLVDVAVVSPATDTARIQELDLHAIHLICEAFEPA